MPEAACRLAPLPNLGVLRVCGTDAAEFLAAQLSQAPPAPGAEQATLAAWHDAKGRVQALFRVVRRDDEYLLITDDSVVDDVTTSLRRYILRAEVTIEALADFACVALVGDSAAWLAELGVGLGSDLWSTATADEVTWLRLGPMLVHAVTAAASADRLAHALPSASSAEAELAEIRLGIPTLGNELRGQFLPQMLNLDVLGGVVFDKGCYPGQEIIARAQNLGSVKRRLLHFTGDTEFTPPTASNVLDGAGRSVGVIVRSAPTSNGFELLAVTQLDAISNALTCAESAGVVLHLEHLPYSVPGMKP